MSLGERMKDRRIELGMSQRDLAERAQVSQGMVNQMERGTKSPSLQLGFIIAKVLGVSVNWLLGVDDSQI